jgi:hypothetical protein
MEYVSCAGAVEMELDKQLMMVLVVQHMVWLCLPAAGDSYMYFDSMYFDCIH